MLHPPFSHNDNALLLEVLKSNLPKVTQKGILHSRDAMGSIGPTRLDFDIDLDNNVNSALGSSMGMFIYTKTEIIKLFCLYFLCVVFVTLLFVSLFYFRPI